MKRICGNCIHWSDDPVDPGYPNEGDCCCPIPMPLCEPWYEEHIAGWELYIDRGADAEKCECFKKKGGPR